MTVEHLIEGIPVILALIMIEGLLSVDNALAIAAMASHLPGKQKILALRLGILGAYVFRGVALGVAVYIKDEIWLRYVGAIYLFYLMSKHFCEKAENAAHGEAELPQEEQLRNQAIRDMPHGPVAAGLTPVAETLKENTPPAVPAHAPLAGMPMRAGLVATVAQIEIMDLALSFDNVIAAVALSDEMWAIVTGVFIGILALRLVAGYAIKLIERFPILADAAFLLIGYIGLILVAETAFATQIHHLEEVYKFNVHTWLPLVKFTGIGCILGLCLLYERHAWMRAATKPLLIAAYPFMWVLNRTMGLIGWPFVAVGRAIGRLFTRGRKTVPAEGS